ncbi:MAG: hypothetical protein ACP5IO_03340, partial [Elusimicrobiales bacterium]
ISNGGNIRGKNDFVNSGNDIISMLKNTGVESVIYMKKFDSSSGSIRWENLTESNVRGTISNNDYFISSNYYPNGTNIDLVIIPDLAIAAVQKLLPAFNDLKK